MPHPLPYQFILGDVGNECIWCLSSSGLCRYELVLLNTIPLVIHGKRVIIITQPYTEIEVTSCKLTDLELMFRKPIPVSLWWTSDSLVSEQSFY